MRYASLRPLLDPILPTVEKPGRYIGLERNLTRKDLSQASVTLALAFPDTYEIGMSHTGLKILYELVNRREDFACERVYAPWVDLEEKMRERGIPLFSTESFAPAGDFDVLGFSLQAELNYSNILNMLELAGIAVWQKDRRESDPLVLGGGPCTANPEPIADFFDAFLVGDAEEALNLFLDAYRDGRSRGLSRRELLVHLSTIDGIYVPSLYDVAYTPEGRIASIARNDPRAPGEGEAHLGPGAQARLLPREAHGSLGRDRAGPPRPRGDAWLHPGLPVLSGRLLVPAGAGARSGRRRGHDEEVHRGIRLERGGAAVAVDGRLLADRAAREVPRAAAVRPARVDLAAVAARRGLLRRPGRRRLRGPQVRLHVRAGDRFRPPPPGHQQDFHQRRHDRGGRRGVRARLGPHQGLHDDRPADRDLGRPG